ncbi:MAG: nucleotide exchange factor GrpE [SAR324 cluster bacterium]|nr:nucleotide exchange factor GrpE [SAR324 cluster bacterium]
MKENTESENNRDSMESGDVSVESPKERTEDLLDDEEAQVSVEKPESVSTVEEPLISMVERLQDAEMRANDMQDRYLRLNAEFENFKKRIAKENADKLKYYHSSLIKDLLPSIDSLEHAIEHAKKNDTNATAILEGIQMVYNMIQDVLGKFGVSRVEAKGELFDPNRHQAIGMVETEEVPDNHVLDMYQLGYFLHDRIVRPAMVRVAKKVEKTSNE